MVCLAAICLGLVLSRAALAGDVDRVAAKSHYEAATRLYDIHEYDAALKEYKAGYLMKPDPSFLYNIGQCYKRLGMPEQAREFFREYLRKAPADDRNRAQAEARLGELDSRDDGKSSPPPAVSGFPPAASGNPSAALPPEPQPSTSGAPALSAAAAPLDPSWNHAAGVDLGSGTSGAAESAPSPYYRTWWFWTGVGAVVAAGVVTAVAWPRSNGQLSVSGTTLGTRLVLQ